MTNAISDWTVSWRSDDHQTENHHRERYLFPLQIPVPLPYLAAFQRGIVEGSLASSTLFP
jgi:hypothetical protein